MSKSTLKEIIIVLLLCIAIILLLAILLYDYVPAKKVLPETVSYTTPQEVTQQLIQSGGIDETQIVKTYELDSSELNNYEKINDYNPGKANPFSSYDTTTETNTTAGQNTTTGNSSTTGNSTQTNSTKQNNTNNNTQQVNTTNENSQYSKDTGTK